MSLRFVIIALFFLVCGLTALSMLQWKFGVGDFIQSPQRILVPLEARMIVGGGRAGIEFVRRRNDKVQLMVRCTEQQQWVRLRAGETSDEICEVRIKLIELSSATGTLATSEAHLEVSWGPLIPPPVDAEAPSAASATGNRT
ncbi:MAG: hypothetical protein AAF657_35100 [Acidobacteriota bacterium]